MLEATVKPIKLKRMLVRDNAQCRETKKIDWMHMVTIMKMIGHLSAISL